MPDQSARFTLLPEGFHGDKHLQKVARLLLGGADNFIETGTNVGSTLLYVARNHPGVSCYSCEPDDAAFVQAQTNTHAESNVQIFREDAVTFLLRLVERKPDCRKQPSVFWLDAHCYGYGWPLPTEISFIAKHFEKPWILIDDCEVPGRPEFAFHSFPRENCSIDTLLQALPPGTNYRLWGPAYREHTSAFHPLTGWCLMALGHSGAEADRLLGQLPAGLINETPFPRFKGTLPSA